MPKKNPKYNKNYRSYKDKNFIKKYILEEFKKKGFTTEAALGFIGNVSHESGNFSAFTEGAKNINNTKGVGMMQWTDNPSKKDMRGQAFLSWSESNGYKSDSLEGNVKYALEELKNGYYASGKEGVGDKSSAITGTTYEELKNGTNVNESVAAFTSGLFRPAYKTKGDKSSGYLGAEERLKGALSFNKTQSNPIEEQKDFTDAESYNNFKKYSKELKDNQKSYDNGDIGEDTWDKNKVEIQQRLHKEFGAKSLQKGFELVNEEKKEVFQKGNIHYKKLEKLDEVHEKLGRRNDGEGKPLSKEEQALFGSYDQRRKAVFAKIRLDADEERLRKLKTKRNESKYGSDEYNKLNKEYKEVKDWTDRLRSGFETNVSTDLSPEIALKLDKHREKLREKGLSEYEIEGHINDYKKKKSLLIVDTVANTNYRVFDGDLGISENIDDLYGLEEYKPVEIHYDEDENSNGGNTPGGSATTTKEVPKVETYDFSTGLDGIGTTKAPTQFADDIEKKQSVKGFLKDNPMALLTTALGVKGAIDSQGNVPEINVKDGTALSASFYEHLKNLETISKKGFTPDEEAAYLKRINDGYMASVETAVRASGGNRAQVLAQAGQLNANKNDSLLDFSAKDAELHRRNLDNYGKVLEYSEAFNERKDTRRQTNEYKTQISKHNEAKESRAGGAALAAGSLKSLIESVNTHRETGEGSAFSKLKDYMVKKRIGEESWHNDDGTRMTKQEVADKRKQMIEDESNQSYINKGSSAAQIKLRSADGTSEEKDLYLANFKNLSLSKQKSAMESMTLGDKMSNLNKVFEEDEDPLKTRQDINPNFTDNIPNREEEMNKAVEFFTKKKTVKDDYNLQN